ncbi:sodium:solute symporter [Sunxiuqinia sp. A32]|uniref:sodium:solute symporter n=1 Tax=Sunxiuqinia sp. A32 TaxID=3461496 RepID=UPI0040458E35
MNPFHFFSIVAGYFVLLMVISWLTSRHSDQLSFFNANKSSPWYLVAYGMLGATLSGVTFISVPGEVGNSAFSYLQFVIGNLVGYWLIAFILLPIYYKLKLISIYSFLEERLGVRSRKTASFFFLISKLIGAAFRFYLVALVLQLAFFDSFGVPFPLTVCISVLLIWLYTYRAGIKTVVWTDTLQTTFLMLALIFTLFFISKEMNWGTKGMISNIFDHKYSQIFFWDWKSPNFFAKQFIAGIFTALAINGMDQDIMQKNLTCKSLPEAQKNMLVFSALFVIVVALFLGLGVVLYQYADSMGIVLPETSDKLYPLLALNYLGPAVGIAFLLGITAAAFSSADSALTALTTSFCIDFLGMDKIQSNKSQKTRHIVHFAFAAILVVVIVAFKIINDESVVVAVFKAVGYTYGPILGLFIFALYFRKKIKDYWVPFIAVLAPIFTYIIASYSVKLFGGYQFGFELLILNGLLMIFGLVLIIRKN